MGWGWVGWVALGLEMVCPRWDVPLDLSTPTGKSNIGTYCGNCKLDNVSKYRVLIVAFQLL